MAEMRENSERLVALRWDDKVEGEYPVELRVEVENRRGMIAVIATRINSMGVNIEKISTDSKDYQFKVGQAVALRQGGDATIIAIGTMVAVALEAAGNLKQEGIDCRVLNMPTIKPIDELLATINIKQGSLFSREVVRTDTMRLGEIYSAEGFAYADVIPVTKEDDENHLVDITYKVSKGEKIRFERINITGNTITRDKVIRRAFKFAEGDYFNGKHFYVFNFNQV